MMKTAWIRAASLGVALLLVGCTTGRDEAKVGVAEFRARAAQHAFGEIYESANSGFRESVTEEKFTQFMVALDRKLGPWQSASDPSWNFMRTTNGHFVKLTYESRFARGRAAEEFVWRIQRGQPSLIGYYVNSPLLLTD